MNGLVSCCQLLPKIAPSCCQLLLARVNTKCISPFFLIGSNFFTPHARKQHLAATRFGTPMPDTTHHATLKQGYHHGA